MKTILGIKGLLPEIIIILFIIFADVPFWVDITILGLLTLRIITEIHVELFQGKSIE